MIDTEIDNRYADVLLRKAVPNGECLNCHLSPSSEKYCTLPGGGNAHRLIYKTKKGPIGDLWVLHTCDNMRCINPDHLFLGTPSDNQQDCISKGRATYLKGRPRYLSDEDKLKIIDMRSRKMTLQYIASEFGVSIGTIRNTIIGYSYARQTR